MSVRPSAPGEIRPRQNWQRDSGFWAVRKFSVQGIIHNAFSISPTNFVGLPAWAGNTYYGIQARMPPGTSEAQFRLMLQALLVDRFQMKAHQEMRPMEVAILTAGTPGPNLRPASRDCVPPPQLQGDTFNLVKASPGSTEFAGCSVSMADVAQCFTAVAVPPVVDETGMKGRYDIDITITSPPTFKGEGQSEIERDGALATNAAFQKQLGLNLDFTRLVKRPMPVLVIGHLAPAPAN